MINPVRLSKWLLLISFFVTYSCLADSPIVPDAKKTPGDALTTDAKVICVSGYSKQVRDVPQAIKEQAYRLYGITSRQPGEYEVDHLISLELGGSNSIRNLWPESFITQPLNAHVKDKLENKLHKLICSGQVSVKQAQQEIAHDWIAAYKKYVEPLSGGGTQIPAAVKTIKADAQPLGVSAQPDGKGGCPPSAPIKVSKKGIFHTQDDPNYVRTKAKNCFSTPEAAQAAGFRPPKTLI